MKEDKKMNSKEIIKNNGEPEAKINPKGMGKIYD